MTDKKIPAVWAINAARKRMGLDDEYVAGVELSGCIMHLALHIEDSEPAPISRELLCAREAAARAWEAKRDERHGATYLEYAEAARMGERDNTVDVQVTASAISLYQSGYGEDEPNG